METNTQDRPADQAYRLRSQLGFKLTRASRIMQRRVEEDLAREGVTRLTWAVMCSIGLERIVTPSGVADNLGVARPVVSKLIRAMTKDGLLDSRFAADNARTRLLSLTEAGQKKLETCIPLVEENAQYFRAKLSDAQLSALHDILDVIAGDEDNPLDTL